MVDMNKVVGLKEARQIVEILKRHYPGVFDGLEIKYGDYYCYDDARHIVYIQWKIDETEEDTIRENAVIDIVNEKYGLNLGYSAREKSMHALLHELGHAADLIYKKAFGQYEEYVVSEEYDKYVFESKKYAYYNMRMELDDVYDEIIKEISGYAEKGLCYTEMLSYRNHREYYINTSGGYGNHYYKYELRYVSYNGYDNKPQFSNDFSEDNSCIYDIYAFYYQVVIVVTVIDDAGNTTTLEFYDFYPY
jgi:hypothetical protein